MEYLDREKILIIGVLIGWSGMALLWIFSEWMKGSFRKDFRKAWRETFGKDGDKRG